MVQPIDQLIHQNISEWALFNVSIASEAAAEESERMKFGGNPNFKGWDSPCGNQGKQISRWQNKISNDDAFEMNKAHF